MTTPTARPSPAPSPPTLMKVVLYMSQVLQNVNDSRAIENAYKEVVADGLGVVLRKQFPQLTGACTTTNNLFPLVPRNCLLITVTSLTLVTSRRLGDGRKYRQLAGTSAGTCSTSKCTVTYQISFYAELLNSNSNLGGAAAAAAAQSSIASTINAAIGDFSLQAAMQTSNPDQFKGILAQQQVSIDREPLIYYARSYSPTPLPSFPPSPAPPAFVTTEGGVATVVVLLGGFILVVLGGGLWYLNEKRKKKASDNLRLASLDKWNKLPRTVNADKEPDFINIYGGYSGYDAESKHAEEMAVGEVRKPLSKGGKMTSKRREQDPTSSAFDVEESRHRVEDDGGYGDEDEDQRRDNGKYGPSGMYGTSQSSMYRPGPVRKGPSVPFRVRAALDAQRKYGDNSNRMDKSMAFKPSISGPELFSPPRDLVKEAANVPDINLWFERYSSRHAKTYWKHQITGEVTWSPPAELNYYKDKSPNKPKKSSEAGPGSNHAVSIPSVHKSLAPQSPEDLRLWTPKNSKKFGMTYYKHALTGEVTWELPSDSPVPEEGRVDQGDPGDPVIWIQKWSDQHRLPYFKRQTDGVLSWDEPTGPEVQIIITSAAKRAKTPRSRIKTRLSLEDAPN